MEIKVRSIIKNLMENGIIPNDVPSMKMSSKQFEDKLVDIGLHPSKYHDSILKEIIVGAIS